MSSQFVDALPYIDHEYNDPQVQLAVAQMVEDEMRRYKQTKNYLEAVTNLPPYNTSQFETDIIRNEYERVKNRIPMENLSMKRYELPPPSAGKLNDVGAWNERLENSFAQLEHQSIRINNLELMNCYGAEAWKAYNAFLTKLVDKSRNQLEELKKEIQEINLERKTKQTEAGEKIQMLGESWVSLVSKNYEIERASLQLELEIAQLERQLEAAQKNEKEN